MSVLNLLYKRLPASLQNVLFTAYGFHARRQRYGRVFYEELRSLIESEWWTETQIYDYHTQALTRLIQHAYDTVPYYRRVMDDRKLKPFDINQPGQLAKLPLLDKQTVKNHREQFISRAVRPGKLIQVRTGGTTGKPLVVSLTRHALQMQWAIWWRHRARFGLRFGDRFLMFGARLPLQSSDFTPPYWRNDYALHRSYLSTYHLTNDTMGVVVKWLNEQEFDFFTGYPSAMCTLADYINLRGLHLRNRPKYVVTGSDALLPTFERSIRKAFGVPVTEQYGMAEACGNFAKCEYGRFHLDFEFCIAELVGDNGQPVSAGQGRLVFTGLANDGMPFIRYDIGDIGTIDPSPCPCGRKSLTLSAIDGRAEDYIRTPDGRKVIGMNQVFEWADGVRETQIVQESLNELQVLVVPEPGYSQTDADKLLHHLIARVGSGMKIRIVLVDSIPRAHNGKVRAVISKLPPQSETEMELRSHTSGTHGL